MVLNLTDNHSEEGKRDSKQRQSNLSLRALHHPGRAFTQHTVVGNATAFATDKCGPRRENSLHKASSSPVTYSTKGNVWRIRAGAHHHLNLFGTYTSLHCCKHHRQLFSWQAASSTEILSWWKWRKQSKPRNQDPLCWVICVNSWIALLTSACFGH